MEVLKELFLNNTTHLHHLHHPQTSKLPALKTPDILAKPPPYRNPTPYKISVLTLVCDLNANLDINRRMLLETIRRFTLTKQELQSLKPGIIDIQYRTLYYGNRNFEMKKTKETQFGNQCTIRILDKNQHIINIKLFNNGVMEFTGIKSINQAQYPVSLIIECLHALKKQSEICESISDANKEANRGRGTPSIVKKRNQVLKYIEARPLTPVDTRTRQYFCNVFKKRNTLTFITKHLEQKDIFRLSLVCKFFWKLFSHRNTKFWEFMHYKLNRVNELQHPTILNTRINTTTLQQHIKNVTIKHDFFITKMSTYKPGLLMTSTTSQPIKLANQNIEMINSNFSTGFNIDQKKLTKLLQKQYPKMNISYEPDDKYHGIKIYWTHQASGVTIFISIFRTGSVLISGPKNEAQLIDAYKFINKHLREFYNEIWVPDDNAEK